MTPPRVGAYDSASRAIRYIESGDSAAPILAAAAVDRVIDLRPVPFGHPEAVALITAVQQVYVDRYGDGDVTPVDPADFAPPHGWFVVGYLDGLPIAAGGWRAQHAGYDQHLRDGDAEIKRMYVADAHRGRGFARAILAEIERSAATAGRRRMVLETGTLQPEAIALYRSAGYEPTPRFGHYRDDPRSCCLAKPLP